MGFQSILFPDPELFPQETTISIPTCFMDLHLDQIINKITKSKENYQLQSFYYFPLHDFAAIDYRKNVFQDLEKEALYQTICVFANGMDKMQHQLDIMKKLHYDQQKERYFLNIIETYAQTLRSMSTALENISLNSIGFCNFRQYLSEYIASPAFTSLCTEANSIKELLANIQYCLNIDGSSIHVQKYEGEEDYRSSVEKTFKKFQQSTAKNYLVEYQSYLEMNHVEATLLSFVAQLHPDVFSLLQNYFKKNHETYCPTEISIFTREIQFYLGYLELILPLKKTGLSFCYPEISDRKTDLYAYDTFDLALANKLLAEQKETICNQFYLKDAERIFIVSGANQGGKTTFARTFGQLHYLAQIGCPVPGTTAKLFLYDHLFTHFEQEETAASLQGKLQNDLLRIHDIFKQATPQSIFILNEIFSSTTLKDAFWLGRKIIQHILDLDAVCVYVTFVDELSKINEQIVSLVSTVSKEKPAQRTYHVIRQAADGRSYALAIVKKHHLTYTEIKERLKK